MKTRPILHRLGFWIVLIPLLAGAPCGCHFTSLHGQPTLNKAQIQAHPPRSLAILPTTDETKHPGLAIVVRRELFSAITPLPYDDRELTEVDAFLAAKAARLGVRPDQLKPEEMADPQLADCVFYSRITRISRLYLLLYAHFRFDMDLELVDARSHQVLYRNHAIYYDRLGSPAYVTLPILGPLALVDVAGNSVKSLWHLRSGRIEMIFRDSAKEIAKTLPPPGFVAMTPDRAMRLTSVQVIKPFPILGAGDRLIVKAQGTPGLRASFSIVKIAQDVPMRENTPGSYFGFYDIRQGDNAKYTIAVVRLAGQTGAELRYEAGDQGLAVDTTPPPRARVVSEGRRFLRSGVFLSFAVNPAEAAQATDKVLEYQLFRRIGGQGNFTKIATSKEREYHDTGVHKGEAVEYYVITRDQAGNTSQPWEPTKLTVG